MHRSIFKQWPLCTDDVLRQVKSELRTTCIHRPINSQHDSIEYRTILTANTMPSALTPINPHYEMLPANNNNILNFYLLQNSRVPSPHPAILPPWATHSRNLCFYPMIFLLTPVHHCAFGPSSRTHHILIMAHLDIYIIH